MTVDAPVTGARPARFVLPVVAALISAGVVTLAGRQLLWNPQAIPGMSVEAVLSWLPPIVAVLMLTAPAAAVAIRPALGRAGGWPIVAIGLGISTLAVEAPFLAAPDDMALVWFVALVAAGFAPAVSGLLIAAAQAPTAERVAIAAGVAFGLAALRENQSLLYFGSGSSFARMLPTYILIGLTLAAGAMSWTRPTLDAARRGSAVIVTVLVAVAVSGLIQLGHYLRQLVVDEFAVSRDGLASQRRIDTVGGFAEYSAIALAAIAGLILLWLGYKRGKADLARWVALGFALGGPSLLVIYGFYYGGAPAQVPALMATAVLAAAAGVVLAFGADRFFPWDALGVAVTALGVIIGSVSYRVGPSSSRLAYLLIAGGFAFALAFGLTRIMRTATATATVHTGAALSMSLGLVALLATANAIAPAAALLAGSNGFEEVRLSVPITSLVAAGVLVLLFGFSRVVDRVRREIREQATEKASL